MHIAFGLHLDGLQPQRPRNAAGIATLGPAGLLGVLETHLGLPTVTVHPSETVFAYLQCLRDASSPERFFHRSLQVDPISVARTLVKWREQWYEAGWDGIFPDHAPARLADMAAVEALATGDVPPSTGQRLQRVAAALANRTVQIERVELHTSLHVLPQAWQRVLAALPCAPAPSLDPVPSAPARSDLGRVQARLLAIADDTEGGVASHERLQGDGSLVVVKSASRDLSAETVAEVLRGSTDTDETLLVAERDGIILDNALERAGLPRCGFQYHTRFRAATQVLKLGLALMWAPVSPQRMLQFLLHPAGPLPRWVRSRLADAVAASPGIGGPAWNHALASIEQSQRARFGVEERDVERMRTDIADWLEGQRHDPRAGAPLDAVITRTQRVSSWAARQLDTTDVVAEAALYAAAHAQAEALPAGLARHRDVGAECISRLELERMVDEVTTDAPDPSTFAEAGHARATAFPAAVTESWPTVVWWDVAPPPAVASYPWTRRELAALRNAGVELPEADALLRHRSRDWLRPVLNATERLVLVVHEDERGIHPIVTQLEHCFEDVAKVEVEPALLRGESALAPLPVPARSLPLHPLPAPRRWCAGPFPRARRPSRPTRWRARSRTSSSRNAPCATARRARRVR